MTHDWSIWRTDLADAPGDDTFIALVPMRVRRSVEGTVVHSITGDRFRAIAWRPDETQRRTRENVVYEIPTGWGAD